MNEFNLKQIEIELSNKKSFTDRLEYWQNIINEYFEKPLIKKFGKYEETFEQRLAIDKLKTELFGKGQCLMYDLLIPTKIFDKYFKDGLKEPEFTYLLLKINAKKYFDVEFEYNKWSEKLKLSHPEDFIKAELKKLNEFETKADELLLNSTVNIFKDNFYTKYNKEVEYLRIKKGYYKTHVLTNVDAIGNTTVVLYAEHIYLKEFLEKELKKIQPKANKKATEITTFDQLFKDKENASKLKKLLKTSFYINENNNWINGGAKYDLAKIYYIIKEETQILKVGSANKQLTIFYKEFNVTNYTMNDLYKAKAHLYENQQKEYDEIYKKIQPQILHLFV